jgi:hypothetical protein
MPVTSAVEVKFDTNRLDFDTVTKIVERAWDLPWLRHSYDSRLDLHMDICAVHANGNPLRLQDLLEADDVNFAHDMGGIRAWLNRASGKLDGSFSPRYSQRVAA